MRLQKREHYDKSIGNKYINGEEEEEKNKHLSVSLNICIDIFGEIAI